VKTRILSALLLGITLGVAATVTIRPAAADAADQMYRIVRALERIAENTGKCSR
jgi:hypothetical protein